jgi:hypothetical protein
MLFKIMTLSLCLIRGTLDAGQLPVSCGTASCKPEKSSLFCTQQRLDYKLLHRVKKHYDALENTDPTDFTFRILLDAACCDYIEEVWIKPKIPEKSQVLYARRVNRLTESEEVKMPAHRFPQIRPTKVSILATESAIRESTIGLDAVLITKIRVILGYFFKDPTSVELALSFPDGGGAIATQLWKKA